MNTAEALRQILRADMRGNGHTLKSDLAPKAEPTPAVPLNQQQKGLHRERH